MFSLPNTHYCGNEIQRSAWAFLVYVSFIWDFQVSSGKSIEDIKKEALREKQERSLEFPKAPGEKNGSLASSAISSFS